VVGDVNGDDKLDLVVVDEDGVLTVLLGDGAGAFAVSSAGPLEIGVHPTAMALFKVTRDGSLGLAIADRMGHLTVLLENGLGGFSRRPNALPSFGTGVMSLAIADFNHDGTDDIALASASGISLLWGDGSGDFVPGMDLLLPIDCRHPLVASGDLNSDGIPDLAVICVSNPNAAVFLGQEGGGMLRSELSLPLEPVALAVADVNGDGSQEIILADPLRGVVVMSRDGAGKFAPSTADSIAASVGPYLLAVADVNMDGKADLVLAGRFANDIVVVTNDLPTITAQPQGVVFNYNASQSAADAAIVVISPSHGPPSTLLVTASQSWITIRPTVTFTTWSSVVEIAPNAVDLPPGEYEGEARVTAPGYFGTSITVTLHVTKPPPNNGVASPETSSSQDSAPVRLRPQAIILAPLAVAALLPASLQANPTDAAGALPLPPEQSIWFAQPPNVPLQTRFAVLTAASSSGKTITFVSLTPHVCSMVDVDVVSLNTAGVCWITATQNGGYLVVVTSDTPPACTVDFSYVVTFLDIQANCYLTATAVFYNASLQVTRSFTVLPSSVPWPQTVTPQPLPTVTFGRTPFSVTAEADSGLPVTFRTITPSVCSVTGASVITIGEGICTLVASQAGDSSWARAATSQSFLVQSSPAGALLPSGSVLQLAAAPFSGAVADFNADGWPDLVVVNQQDNSVAVLLGDGAGGFITANSIPVGTRPAAALSADFNEDGKLDLAIVNQGSNSVTILLGDGAGHFAAAPGSPVPVGTSPVSITVGEFNGDGHLDLAVANQGSQDVTVLLGDGSGRFSVSPTSPLAIGVTPAAIVAADLNGAGRSDLAVASQAGNAVILFLSDGVGGFMASPNGPIAVGVTPSALILGDFNTDGLLDLAVPNSAANNVSVILADGMGGFTAPSISPTPVGTTAIALLTADFDGDGRSDLAVLNSGSRSLTLLLGNGTGGFSPAPGGPIFLTTYPSAVAVGDFNSDGRVDLAILDAFGRTASTLSGAAIPTTAALSTPTQSPVAIGTPIPITATVTGSPGSFLLPAGIATLLDNGNSIATAPYSLSPQFFTVTPAAGSHSFTLEFTGDTKTASTTSPPLTIQVNAPVASVPDLTIVVSHTGVFGQEQVGASMLLTIRNVGGVASAGIVTVLNALPNPAAVIATAMAGPGWQCDLTSLTCTRSAALVPGGTYPITITLNVLRTAPATFTDSATVSGGGGPNNGYDASSDIVTVTQVRTISVVPASGSGASESFTVSVGDTAGYKALSALLLLISSTGSAANACMMMYDVANNTVSLASDSGTLFPYVMQLGGAGSVQNGQCTVSAQGASVSGVGESLTVTLPVSFHQAFASSAAKSILVFARDVAGGSAGWDVRGSWVVTSGVQSIGGPTVATLAVSPSSGAGSSQVFTFTVGDSSGYRNLFGMMVLITSTQGASNSCMFMYDAASSSVSLADDAGTFSSYAMTVPGTATVQNDQCALSAAGATISGTGNTLAVTVQITFGSSFAGLKSIMLYTRDFGGAAAGWDVRGTWSVPGQ
jgi:hypothetical protein